MSDSLTYKDAVNTHHNHLFDAVALLDAAAERVDAATPSATDDADGAATMHNTLRLVQMAQEIVKTAAEDFSRCM
jgi:hypothetical protein